MRGGDMGARKRSRSGAGRRWSTTGGVCLWPRKDAVFLQRQALGEPGGITHFSSAGWGASERPLDPKKHTIGTTQTETIASTHSHVRTRIKRLVRRMMGFSQTTPRHDLVLGLFIH